ncbi:MAG: tetratricopeptide repeat protein [Alphaproteobacteria bacterium]|nr:tetratricopeptide repeat protein [Alphaproteobacteria bacterium]
MLASVLGLGLPATITATATLTAPAALAQQIDSREAIALRNQIDRLRAEVQQLRDQVGRNGGGGGGGSSLGIFGGGGSRDLPQGQQELLARLLERVQQLDAEVRDLRGRSDETQNAVRRLTEQLEKGLGDLDFRIQQLQGGEGAAPAPRGGTTATPPRGGGTAGNGGQAPAPANADEAFESALARFRANDFNAARTGFEAFMQRFPRHARAPEAIYRLGETHIARRDFRAAAVTFDDSVTRFPRGPRVQESMLMRGVALARLGERAAACSSLAELRQRFPQMKQAVREQWDAERRRLNCG